jgi:hypothetical protein
MTFEQFQASKKWSDDLARDVSSENWEEIGTPKGWLYLGVLYIDQVQAHWPDQARAQGQWHLIIGREEWLSDDLAGLEAELYEFAKSEGYFD